MRAYLDTSALVKLLIVEDGSVALADALTGVSVCTSRASYVEARAAVARREREASAPREACAAARLQLQADWPAYTVIELSPDLAEMAAEFAETFALRGFDAIQLASAHLVKSNAPEAVSFFAFDRRLNRAARLLGLNLPSGALL
ncbi:MAG: type II toxin-antitoxin system VapC family toxin [Burkholderiaceae bacterium]|nr:type II toxin-antitoxin system VapC family toxin [Burkholderiaceae bacterium]